MTVSADDVRRIARLARLAIDDQDIPGYADQLSRILALVEQMNAADTSGLEPLSHPLGLAQRLRPDEVTEDNRREQFQAHAPRVEAGLYLVPKVIE